MVAADPGGRRGVELREPVVPLRATRTIGTDDRCDITHGGIYPPHWAELRDMRPRGRSSATRAKQPLRIDPFATSDGSRTVSSRQAGWHVVAANESNTDTPRTSQCSPYSPRTLIAFCTPKTTCLAEGQQHVGVADGVDHARSVIDGRDDQDTEPVPPTQRCRRLNRGRLGATSSRDRRSAPSRQAAGLLRAASSAARSWIRSSSVIVCHRVERR